jgi:exodeoxyribonuclease VII large subunit
MMQGFEAASVSDLVISIKNLLSEEFQEVMVQGEVTNLAPSSAGHWYFTLSDENACISCALFKGDVLRNPLIRTIKDGDKLIILGPVSVFQKRGTLQLQVKRIMPAGEGQLKLQFERLKAKLAAEGLFDLSKKRKIPTFPKRIAVITAERGAALQDFLNVLKRRSLWLDVLIIPAVVQGEGAPRSLIAGLKKAQEISDIDVIVLTRGGGSLEDLWAFNDEELVREISRSKVPTLSAVGHQVDFTLCDFVADFRSETPTAAAETLSQPQTELKGRILYCQSHLHSQLFKLSQHVQLMAQKFHPKELLGIIWQRVQESQKRLSKIRLRDRGEELTQLLGRGQELDELIMRLNHSVDILFSQKKEHVKRLDQVLRALNPNLVLGRGYSYVKVKGKVLSSIKQFESIKTHEIIEIQFQDGVGTAIKESP